MVPQQPRNAYAGQVVQDLPDLSSVAPSPDLLTMVLQAKWLLALGLCGGLLLGGLALLKVGPTYDATSRILVTKRVPEVVKEDERDTGSLGDRAEHIPLIMSPKIVSAAVRKYELTKLKTLAAEDEPAQAIIDSLRVRRTAGQDKSALNVFDLSYNCGNEADAVRILAAVIDAYHDYLKTSRAKHSQESVDAIQLAANKLLKELNQRQKEYLEFQKTTPLHWRNAPGTDGQPGDLTNVHQERVIAIEAERRVNLLLRTTLESRLASLEAAITEGEPKERLELLVRTQMQLSGEAGNALIAGADAQSVSALQNQLLQLLLDESKLMTDYGRDYPDLVEVRRKIARVKDFFRHQGIALPVVAGDQPQTATVAPVDLVSVYRLSLRQQISETTRREVELDKMFEHASKTAKGFAHFLVDDRRHNNEIKQLQTLWDGVVGRLKKAQLTEDNQGYDMEELSPVRAERSIKRPLQCLGMGGAFGLAVVFGFVYWRATSNHKLSSAEEMQTLFHTQVLGQIPQFTLPTEDEVLERGLSLDPSLFYMTSPGSQEAEAYRSLRTALFFRCQRAGYKVIQVTSPEPRDGKSTVACNMALAMAHSGKRVLLIDADLRCPRVHHLFNLHSELGLSDVLLGEVELVAALQEASVTGLKLLCAGLTPANPAELLGMREFDDLITKLREDYDFIIIDTPPLTAVSDPCIVAGRADSVVLVVRVNKNDRSTVRHSCELLNTLGIDVLGAVANDVAKTMGAQYGNAYLNPDSNARQKRAAEKTVNVLSTTSTN